MMSCGALTTAARLAITSGVTILPEVGTLGEAGVVLLGLLGSVAGLTLLLTVGNNAECVAEGAPKLGALCANTNVGHNDWYVSIDNARKVAAKLL